MSELRGGGGGLSQSASLERSWSPAWWSPGGALEPGAAASRSRPLTDRACAQSAATLGREEERKGGRERQRGGQKREQEEGGKREKSSASDTTDRTEHVRLPYVLCAPQGTARYAAWPGVGE